MNKDKIAKFLVYLFLIIPFFPIQYFTNNITIIATLYKVWLVISTLIVILLILKEARYSKIINYIIIYLLILLLSTIINNGEILKCINMIFQVIAVCLVFDYEIRHDSKMFLSVTEFFFSVIIYINFLTILLYPQGMYIGSNGYYSNWFLGFKNIFILYMLPAMLFSYLNSYSKNKISVNTILLSLIIIISIILTNSATGIVGVLVFFATLILSKVIKSTKILNIKVFSYIYIASFLAIVILRLQNLFSFFIVDVLHKDITFTGRTYIWDYVYQFISQKKLLGYGVENSLTRLNKTSYLKSYHAHNQILEIIYKSGFIGLISFILLAYVSLKQLFKHKQTKQALIISITIFSYFVISLTEAYDYEYIMFIFVIAYNIENFIKDVQ